MVSQRLAIFSFVRSMGVGTDGVYYASQSSTELSLELCLPASGSYGSGIRGGVGSTVRWWFLCIRIGCTMTTMQLRGTNV